MLSRSNSKRDAAPYLNPAPILSSYVRRHESQTDQIATAERRHALASADSVLTVREGIKLDKPNLSRGAAAYLSPGRKPWVGRAQTQSPFQGRHTSRPSP
jgi:hypothetical protein